MIKHNYERIYMTLGMLICSYKTRGAFNALMTIPKDERRKGVVTACQGNHGVVSRLLILKIFPCNKLKYLYWGKLEV